MVKQLPARFNPAAASGGISIIHETPLCRQGYELGFLPRGLCMRRIFIKQPVTRLHSGVCDSNHVPKPGSTRPDDTETNGGIPHGFIMHSIRLSYIYSISIAQAMVGSMSERFASSKPKRSGNAHPTAKRFTAFDPNVFFSYLSEHWGHSATQRKFVCFPL